MNSISGLDGAWWREGRGGAALERLAVRVGGTPRLRPSGHPLHTRSGH